MSALHAKLAAHTAIAPTAFRLGALAIALAVVGGVLLETAHIAAGIVA